MHISAAFVLRFTFYKCRLGVGSLLQYVQPFFPLSSAFFENTTHSMNKSLRNRFEFEWYLNVNIHEDENPSNILDKAAPDQYVTEYFTKSHHNCRRIPNTQKKQAKNCYPCNVVAWLLLNLFLFWISPQRIVNCIDTSYISIQFQMQWKVFGQWILATHCVQCCIKESCIPIRFTYHWPFSFTKWAHFVLSLCGPNAFRIEIWTLIQLQSIRNPSLVGWKLVW